MAGRKKGLLSKLILVAVIAAVLVVFGPRLIHQCDDCEKWFFGTGYDANALVDMVSEEDQIICKECAEKHHKLSSLMGKDLSEFRHPLF